MVLPTYGRTKHLYILSVQYNNLMKCKWVKKKNRTLLQSHIRWMRMKHRHTHAPSSTYILNHLYQGGFKWKFPSKYEVLRVSCTILIYNERPGVRSFEVLVIKFTNYYIHPPILHPQFWIQSKTTFTGALVIASSVWSVWASELWVEVAKAFTAA